MEKNLKEKLLPFILTIIVIVLDQITKALVVRFIPPYTIGTQFFGDFLRLIHVYNPGVAFSFGASWPDLLRRIAFSIMPLIFLGIVIVVYMKSNDFTKLQRWAIAGIVGGGIGNLIDRIFRPEGVVDFIDVKFYGLFGMERWPTFNVADSAVVVCGILLIVSFIAMTIKDSKSKKEESKEV
jgi:signal peptidase II